MTYISPGHDDLSLTVQVRDGRATIELTGRLTAATGDLVVGVVDGELAGGPAEQRQGRRVQEPPDLVLDLSGVSNCDVGGVRAVQEVRDHATAMGLVLTLQGLPAPDVLVQPPMWFDDLLTRPARTGQAPR